MNILKPTNTLDQANVSSKNPLGETLSARTFLAHFHDVCGQIDVVHPLESFGQKNVAVTGLGISITYNDGSQESNSIHTPSHARTRIHTHAPTRTAVPACTRVCAVVVRPKYR